jgi:flagellar hook-associated protein 3 FlgL
MKISTRQMFEQATAQLGRTTRELARTQAQLGSGQRNVFVSDDPASAVPLLRLDSLVRRHEGHQAQLGTLRDKLSSRETALQGSSDALLRVRDLALQAGSDTLTAGQRRSVGIEVGQLREQLLALANRRDTSGQPVFAGASHSSAPYARDASGAVQYGGDQTALHAPIGDGQVMVIDAGGSSVFRPVQRDGAPVPFFDALDDLVRALEANDGAAIRRGAAEADLLRTPLTLALADTGYQRGQVEAQSDLVAEQIVQLQSMVSERRDVDYAEAATRMRQQLTALEAAQASLARIGELSLFNHLR